MSKGADVRVLLAHTDWIRALARSLAGDVQVAEDLAQDAWLTALQRPPRTDRSVRGWLATVLRNRLADWGRERGWRERGERDAARNEALLPTHDVVERAALQRALVEAVLELDEPFRTTVLLRFFEDVPQREIARRMQTSTATVNSRLTRALDKLRERLMRDGGREAWLQALLPLLSPPGVAPVTVLGVSAMKLAVTAVLAASLLAGIVLWRLPSASTRVGPSAPARVSSVLESRSAATRSLEPGVEPVVGTEPAHTVSERVPVPARPSDIDSAEPVPEAAARTVRGRVLDAFGNGLAGVTLATGSGEASGVPEAGARCTSGAGGWFETDVHTGATVVISADPRYTTVLAAMARVLREIEPLVVVAPRIELAGIVVDEGGAPVAGAGIRIQLPAGFGAEWGIALDYSLAQDWRTQSGTDGRFTLPDAPALEGAMLRAALGGYAAHAEPAPLGSERALVIVLARSSASDHLVGDHLVHGIVLDPAGAPVEGARVAARGESTLTRRDGEFALDLAQADVRPPLIAVKRGYLPAQFEPERDAHGAPAWPAAIVLRLGAPPPALRGRVVDDDGRPVEGALVWLDDPTIFGLVDETLLAAESMLRDDERFWSFAVTDTDGAFALEGLLERAYRVQALELDSLVTVEREKVRASESPVTLVLPTHDVLERVAGRVVSRRGDPVPGARVVMIRKTLEVELAEGHQNDARQAQAQVTGADGAFEFTHVPRDVHLLVTGDTILFSGTSIADEHDVTNIRIPVGVRLHLQVELDPPLTRADGLRVLDELGREVILNVMAGEGAHFGPRMPILDGRSAVISVDEGAAVLVLLLGEKEVARLPLDLAPGAPSVVRY